MKKYNILLIIISFIGINLIYNSCKHYEIFLSKAGNLNNSNILSIRVQKKIKIPKVPKVPKIQAKEEKISTIYIEQYKSKTLPIGFNIPSTVSTIAQKAFKFSVFNDNLIIPFNVTTLGGVKINKYNDFYDTGVFNNSKFEKNLIIEANITKIDYDMFSQIICNKDLIIKSKIIEIKEYAFVSATFYGRVVLPESLVVIEKEAFMEAIFHVDLFFGKNSSLTTIGESAFFYADFLNKFELPSTVTTIEKSAFEEAKLPAGFKIPDSVITLGKDAFKNVELPTNHRWSGNITNDSSYIPKVGDKIISN